jgi:hypothetical protein
MSFCGSHNKQLLFSLQYYVSSFITETECLYHTVRTETSYVIQVKVHVYRVEPAVGLERRVAIRWGHKVNELYLNALL